MKKLLTIILILASCSTKAQDSTQITIQWQARDIEFAGRYICDLPQFETVYDSVKLKFRIVNAPTGTTNVQVTAYTIDMMRLYNYLNSDVIAVNNNVTSRLKTLLLAVNQPYLTNYVNSVDAANQDAQQNGRTYGRFRLRKSNN